MLTSTIKEQNVPFYENTIGVLALDADGKVQRRITLPAQYLEGVDELVLFVSSGVNVYPIHLKLSEIISAQYLAETQSVEE